jgi:hypothetical protein
MMVEINHVTIMTIQTAQFAVPSLADKGALGHLARSHLGGSWIQDHHDMRTSDSQSFTKAYEGQIGQVKIPCTR